jgi:hypothetical protein
MARERYMLARFLFISTLRWIHRKRLCPHFIIMGKLVLSLYTRVRHQYERTNFFILGMKSVCAAKIHLPPFFHHIFIVYFCGWFCRRW